MVTLGQVGQAVMSGVISVGQAVEDGGPSKKIKNIAAEYQYMHRDYVQVAIIYIYYKIIFSRLDTLTK